MSTDIAQHDSKTIEEALQAAIEAVGNRGEVTNVFLVACGGSFALMIPGQWIIQSQTGYVEAHALNARELTTRKPQSLGSNSIVFLCSHSGNTPETVEAATYAREMGALTVALTHVPGSPLGQAAECVIPYQHGDQKDFGYTAAPLLYRLVYSLLDKLEGSSRADDVTNAIAKLDGIVRKTQGDLRQVANAWGKEHARSEIIYTLGSGPNYGVAYSFAICLLQEMLWIHSQGINAAEYFHGPFEITDYDVPFMSIIGLGDSRMIDERARDFVMTKSDDVLQLDAADWDLSEIPESLHASYSHLVLSPVMRLFADALADHKGHPLTVRRYMWRMKY